MSYASDVGLPSLQLQSLASGSFASLGGVLDDSSPDPDLVDPLPPELRCVQCHRLLRTPCQTPCGHRICRRCVEELQTRCTGVETLECPAGEDGCTAMRPEEITPDYSAGRQIRNLKARCTNAPRGCREELPLFRIKDHLEKTCKYNVVECPNGCGATDVSGKQLDEHLRICPRQQHDCNFKLLGCDVTGTTDELQRHNVEAAGKHLELVAETIAKLELQVVRQRASFEAMNTELSQLTRVVQTELRGVLEVVQRESQAVALSQKQFEQSNLRSMAGLSESVVKHDEKLARLQTDFQRDMTSLREKLGQLETMVSNGLRNSRAETTAAASVPESVRTQLTGHDRTIGMHDVRLAEMDLRIQCAETTNYDGVLIWKVGQYRRRKREAASGGTLSLYSQPFYTSRYGYKMCARVYLNGDGAGRGSHISFFFVVMQGDYDELLAWPFRQRVTLSLLDQRGGSGPTRRNLADTFRPDPTSTSFQKPSTPMNVASGCPLFIEHAKLEAPDSVYLVGDTLYFKISVDTSDLLNP